MVAVDSLHNVEEISKVATEADVTIRLLIELNCGMDRCGIDPGESVVDFVAEVAQFPGVRVAGLMSWEGHAVAIEDPVEKEQVIRDAVGLLLDTAELVRGAGFEIPIVSCGGSGTYKITSKIPGVTEIQAGGAVFCDVAYRKWGVDTECSLFIYSTVISRPTSTRAVVDAGRKAMNGDVALPELVDISGVKIMSLHAEHGLLELENPNITLEVGDKVDFIVGYGDNNVYLHDQLFGVRKGKVEVVWDISARGKLT